MVPLEVAAPPIDKLGAPKARLAALETGRRIYTGAHKCAHCHRPRPINNYDREYWAQSIMPRMSKKAGLSEVEERYLMEYIVAACDAASAPHAVYESGRK
jgi:hypothetical protein